MSELTVSRQDWLRVKFGDVVKLNKSRVADPAAEGIERYVGIEHIEPEDLRIRSWGHVADGTTFTNYFEPGQVLFVKRRAYQRKVAVADFAGVCSGDIYVLESKDADLLLPELLPFICQTESFFEHAVGTSAGSLSPRTNWTQFASYEFALPPLAEQRCIAEVLQHSRKVIEASRRSLISLQQLRKSAIDELCSVDSGAQGRFGDYCSMQNGRAFPGAEYQDAGIRLLRPGNLAMSGYLDWSSGNTTYLPDKYTDEANDYVIRPGDVLINLTAQSLEDGFMGRACLAREGDYSLLNQRIGRFIFDSPKLIPEYAWRLLQTSSFQRHAISMCEGTKVKHIYWRHIDRFEFRLPSIDVQKRIVSLLCQIDASIDKLVRRSNQNYQLHSSLINDLMRAETI